MENCKSKIVGPLEQVLFSGRMYPAAVGFESRAGGIQDESVEKPYVIVRKVLKGGLNGYRHSQGTT